MYIYIYIYIYNKPPLGQGDPKCAVNPQFEDPQTKNP